MIWPLVHQQQKRNHISKLFELGDIHKPCEPARNSEFPKCPFRIRL